MAQPRSSAKKPEPKAQGGSSAMAQRAAERALARSTVATTRPAEVMPPRAPQAQDATPARGVGLIRSPRQLRELLAHALQGGTVESLSDVQLQTLAKALGATELPEVGGRQARRDQTLVIVNEALGKHEERERKIEAARLASETPQEPDNQISPNEE